MSRKSAFLALAASLIIVLACGSPAPAAKNGTKIGNLKFSGPVAEADRQYLGLKGDGAFNLQEVQAPYVLVEIMRTSCPHCEEQAPGLNRLFHLVSNSDLKGKVKFIGVGESDHPADLRRFRAEFKVPFPLVPDPDWDIGTLFNISGTPTTVVLDKSGKVLLVEEGVFNSPAHVFKKLKSKLK